MRAKSSIIVSTFFTLFITAALLALHPMHADVVGWISARSYLLCTSFSLLSLIFYVRYLTSVTNTYPKILLSLLFFILACLSKSQAVMLAPVMLIIHWIYGKKYNFRQILILTVFIGISAATGFLTI